MYKKSWYTCKVVVLLIKPIVFFLRSRCRPRRWILKSLLSEVALLQSLSPLFHLVQFVKCWQFFLELSFKRLYRRSEKEKESRCLVFTCSTKREIRHIHVVVLQRRQRNVQKRVMHVQSSCFAHLNLFFFCVLVAVTVVVA